MLKSHTKNKVNYTWNGVDGVGENGVELYVEQGVLGDGMSAADGVYGLEG